MSQLHDIFANEIHQAKKLTLFEPKSTSNSSKESKDINNPLEPADLKAEPIDPTDCQNLPELKVEATPSGEKQNEPAPVAPEKNKNLIMGLLKK